MPLVPKITIVSKDNAQGKTIVVGDATGNYNVSTNPGGFGAPNYTQANVDWVLLGFRNYADDSFTYQQITDLTDLFGSGEMVDGISSGIFTDGMTELKYYLVIANPVLEGADTPITWTPGTMQFNLTGASTLLVGVKAIIIKSSSQTKLFFIDETIPIGANTASVTEALPSDGSGLVAFAYEGSIQFLMTSQGDDCLAKFIARVVQTCSCYSDEMRQVYLRQGQRTSVDTFFNAGNYQAAHEISLQLQQYCDKTSQCAC